MNGTLKGKNEKIKAEQRKNVSKKQRLDFICLNVKMNEFITSSLNLCSIFVKIGKNQPKIMVISIKQIAPITASIKKTTLLLVKFK